MIRRLALALMLALAFAGPAAAHKLRVFVAIKGNVVAGYAFFIGGGRAQDIPWDAKAETGKTLAEGRTGPEGDFRFVVPVPIASDITITVNTQEGHIASTTLAAARFGAEPAQPEAVLGETGTDTAAPVEATEPPQSVETAVLVEAAVQRQIVPLLQRIEEMDSRMRYTDILSGIFLIVGMAGTALWLRGRRR